MANSPDLWLGGLLQQTWLMISHNLNILFCLGVVCLWKTFAIENIVTKQLIIVGSQMKCTYTYCLS